MRMRDFESFQNKLRVKNIMDRYGGESERSRKGGNFFCNFLCNAVLRFNDFVGKRLFAGKSIAQKTSLGGGISWSKVKPSSI